MKRNKVFLLSGLVIIAGLLLFILKGDGNENPKLKRSDNADSLWSQINEMKVGKYEMPAFRELHRLSMIKDKEKEHNKLLKLVLARGEKEDNDRVLLYYNVNEAFNKIYKFKYDSALIHGKAAMEIGKKFDDISPCLYYSPISLAYYHKGNMSEAINYMKMGYDYAKSHNDYANINMYATNLGTLYFNNSMFGTASRYFQDAVVAGEKANIKNGVLVNNIISIQSTENGPLSTLDEWKKYDSLLNHPQNEYERQLTTLNRVNLLQAQRRWNDANTLLAHVPDNEMDPYFAVNKMNLVLNDLERQPNKFPLMEDYIQKHMSWVSDNFTQAFSELFEHFVTVIDHNPRFFNLDSLHKWEKLNEENFKQNPYAKSNLYEVYGKIYQGIGNFPIASTMLTNSLVFGREYSLLTDSIKRADFNERMELMRKSDNLKELTLELERKSLRNKFVTIILISLMIILTLIVSVLWLLNRKREKSLELIQVQLNQQEEEQRFLKKERELNDRIVSLTHMLMEKTTELGKRLRNMNYADKEDLEQLRKELEAMGRVDAGTNPQVADVLIKENDDLLNKYPVVKDLNLTERRIFILSVEGFKSKDISNLVGVTPQYIHNVRSKIRKVLGVDNNIRWEELK